MQLGLLDAGDVAGSRQVLSVLNAAADLEAREAAEMVSQWGAAAGATGTEDPGKEGRN